jgi:hypothetical protein
MHVGKKRREREENRKGGRNRGRKMKRRKLRRGNMIRWEEKIGGRWRK